MNYNETKEKLTNASVENGFNEFREYHLTDDEYVYLDIEVDNSDYSHHISVSVCYDSDDGTTAVRCKKWFEPTEEGIKKAIEKAKAIISVLCE